MAKKEETIDSKYKNLSGKTLKELLTLKDGLTYLIQYWDNVAQATSGNYQYGVKESYENAKLMSSKYNLALLNVISAIEEKVNEEIFG